MFLSTYSSKEMREFTESDLMYVLGYSFKGELIKPVRCRKCGEFSFIDPVLHLAQCPYCNSISKIYCNETPDLEKDWSVLNE